MGTVAVHAKALLCCRTQCSNLDRGATIDVEPPGHEAGGPAVLHQSSRPDPQRSSNRSKNLGVFYSTAGQNYRRIQRSRGTDSTDQISRRCPSAAGLEKTSWTAMSCRSKWAEVCALQPILLCHAEHLLACALASQDR
jgi:hypothetical protein